MWLFQKWLYLAHTLLYLLKLWWYSLLGNVPWLLIICVCVDFLLDALDWLCLFSLDQWLDSRCKLITRLFDILNFVVFWAFNVSQKLLSLFLCHVLLQPSSNLSPVMRYLQLRVLKHHFKLSIFHMCLPNGFKMLLHQDFDYVDAVSLQPCLPLGSQCSSL